MSSALHVVKIGGKLINNEDQLSSFLQMFTQIETPKVLIHGGGQKATELSALLGIETRMVDGRRITNKDTLDVAVMVYAGLINKRIVARLQASGINALGLAGCDANIIQAVKRPVGEIDFGWVGDIVGVDQHALKSLISSDFIPVFSAISHNGKGQLLNTNADTIAAQIAIALSSEFNVHLHYCFEYDGVLYDMDTPDLTMEQITRAEFEELKSSKGINKGMIPKLSNGFDALAGGVHQVAVCGISNLISQKRATMLTL